MYVLSAKELNNSSKSKDMVTRGRGGFLPHTYIFSAICQRNCFNLDIDIDIDIDISKKKKNVYWWEMAKIGHSKK